MGLALSSHSKFLWAGAFISAASAHAALAFALNISPAAPEVEIAGEPVAIELALMAVSETVAVEPPKTDAEEIAAEPEVLPANMPELASKSEAVEEPEQPVSLPSETRETYREPIVEQDVAKEVEAPQPVMPFFELPPEAPMILPQVATVQPPVVEPVIEPEIASPVPEDTKPEVALPLPAPVELKKQDALPIAKPVVEPVKPKVEKPKAKPQAPKPQKPNVKKPKTEKHKAKVAEQKAKPKPEVKKTAGGKPVSKTKVDGKKKGDKDSAGKTGNATATASVKAGNAAASNYPGKVYSKIRRTRQKSAGGSGAAMVAFAVGAGGQIISISLAGSSGNPSLDRAALDHVRRAAPFSAPPDGAQTRFNIPIEFRR